MRWLLVVGSRQGHRPSPLRSKGHRVRSHQASCNAEGESLAHKRVFAANPIRTRFSWSMTIGVATRRGRFDYEQPAALTRPTVVEPGWQPGQYAKGIRVVTWNWARSDNRRSICITRTASFVGNTF